MVNILDNEFVTLVYEDENALLFDVYKANIAFETIQASLNAGLQKMNETHANRWLTDTRAIGGFSEAGAQWVLTDWAPRALEAGWKYWALVVPEAMEGRVAMVQFVNAFAQVGIRVRVFIDINKARQWVVNIVDE